jgi:hypothetical protein
MLGFGRIMRYSENGGLDSVDVKDHFGETELGKCRAALWARDAPLGES